MKSTTFGKRLSEVRKSKKMSQDELAKKLDVHGAVIGRYERDEVKPSIEMAASIAEALEVSLDYLVGNTDLLLEKNVVNKIVDIQKLNSEDRAHVFALLDAFLQSHKAKKVFAS
jgi:transcriptional regulator with XRE-family HTH domain